MYVSYILCGTIFEDRVHITANKGSKRVCGRQQCPNYLCIMLGVVPATCSTCLYMLQLSVKHVSLPEEGSYFLHFHQSQSYKAPLLRQLYSLSDIDLMIDQNLVWTLRNNSILTVIIGDARVAGMFEVAAIYPSQIAFFCRPLLTPVVTPVQAFVQFDKASTCTRWHWSFVLAAAGHQGRSKCEYLLEKWPQCLEWCQYPLF